MFSALNTERYPGDSSIHNKTTFKQYFLLGCKGVSYPGLNYKFQHHKGNLPRSPYFSTTVFFYKNTAHAAFQT